MARLPIARMLILPLSLLLVLPSATAVTAGWALHGVEGWAGCAASPVVGNEICPPGSDLWQLVAGGQAALATFGLTGFGIGASLALGLGVWVAPALQYGIFQLGRLTLTPVAGALVALEGLLAVWLSYWVTALLFQIYVPQIVAVAAVVAVLGVWNALRSLFRRVPTGEVDGEVVALDRNPSLWGHLRALADRVGTAPPTTLIAGIDDNFFVSEAPLQCGGRRLTGRSLYVSVPLLRVLSDAEADAVLAHELAHFRGGDARTSARLGPAVAHFDSWLGAVGEGLGLLVQPLLVLFRAVFELARQRESRRRELRADRASADAVSVDSAARALWKVAAYSTHRAQVEQGLFEVDAQHAEALAIKDRAVRGLAEHAASPAFREAIAQANAPHPFDSHPALEERLAALGSTLTADQAGRLFDAPPPTSWVDRFPDADDIEGRLWAQYEARFTEAHAESLAYRYVPDTEEELRVVEATFPPVLFHTRSGAYVRVTCTHLETADGKQLRWEELARATLRDGTFARTLRLEHTPGAAAGRGPTIVRLRTLDEPGAAKRFQEVVGRYWQRSAIARAHAANRADPTG